jgi:HK97 gp10 family phage protein
VADVEVKGLAELDALLKTLPVKIETNILRGAVRAGLSVLRKTAKAKVPVQSGALRSSIRLRTNTKAAKRGYARVDLAAGDKMAWYAHLLEFGTGQYYDGKGRSVRRPYLIKATDKQGRRVSDRETRRLNQSSQAHALYFQGKMRSSVDHPGIHPVRFMRDAAADLDGSALDAFVAYVQKRLPREIEKTKS